MNHCKHSVRRGCLLTDSLSHRCVDVFHRLLQYRTATIAISGRLQSGKGLKCMCFAGCRFVAQQAQDGIHRNGDDHPQAVPGLPPGSW